MGAPRSPWMVRAYELLADGDWHDRDAVVTAVMPLVPPGKAIRQHQRDLEGARARRAANGAPPSPAGRRPGNPTTSGARRKAMNAISRATADGRIERRTVAGVTQIRLTQ